MEELFTIEQAQELKARYPWFKAPRIFLQAVTGERDESLDLHFTYFPRPEQMLKKVYADDFNVYDTLLVIDTFLSCDDVHVVSKESVTDEDMSDVEVDYDDDMVTEDLAEIYLAQGHKSIAKAMYSKLSLLYPEKSVYFAGIIDNINKN